ncbi:hypothetical protein ACLB2K_031211 [Fragaria x ananassa]
MWSVDVKERSGDFVVWGCDLYRSRMNMCVLIQQGEDIIFIFQFKDQKVKDMILNGGLWYFNIFMLLLVEYDGVADLIETAAALHYSRVCVALKGLRIVVSLRSVTEHVASLALEAVLLTKGLEVAEKAAMPLVVSDFSNPGVQNSGELEIDHTGRKDARLGRDELVQSNTVAAVKMAVKARQNFFAGNPNFKLIVENRLGPVLIGLEECGYEMTGLDLVSRPKPYSAGQMFRVFGLELDNFPLNLGEVVEVPINGPLTYKRKIGRPIKNKKSRQRKQPGSLQCSILLICLTF